MIRILMLAVAMAGPVQAQEVFDQRSMAKALFSTRGFDVLVAQTLSEKDAATVKALVPLMEQQIGAQFRYYGAIAWSPDDGLVHESLQGALNHHTPEAADAAALAACAPLQSSGVAPCQVAARIVPRRYEDRPVTLSAETTDVFNSVYRKGRGPRALAISPETGGWGIGATAEAAISACAEGPPLSDDCRVIVQD